MFALVVVSLDPSEEVFVSLLALDSTDVSFEALVSLLDAALVVVLTITALLFPPSLYDESPELESLPDDPYPDDESPEE